MFLKNVINMFERDSIEILQAESSHNFPLHSHESFCLGIVNEGKVKFHIDKQEKVLLKGMLFLIPSNVGVIITPIERYKYITICFKNEAKEYFMKYSYKNFFPELKDVDYIRKACNLYLNGATAKEFVESIASILRPYRLEPRKPDTDDYLIELGKNFIKQHIYERFSLEKLAEHVHVSKYHYIRKFKQKTGVTPNQYYIQAKLFAAKQALKNNERETELAADLNFSDQCYMCNVFKKQMGISMKDFKEHYYQL